MSHHGPLPWTRDRYGNYQDADGERVVLVDFSLAGGYTPETDPCHGNTALVGQAVNAHAALVTALEALSAMYAHAWDLVDGDLLMPKKSVEQFEEAHERAQSALALAREETVR